MMRKCWCLYRQSDRPHGLLLIQYTEVAEDYVRARVLERHAGAQAHVGMVVAVDEKLCFDYDHRLAAMRALHVARERQREEKFWENVNAITRLEGKMSELQQMVLTLTRKLDSLEEHR